MVSDPEVRSSARRSAARWFTGFLVLACAGLSVEVVLLARRNRDLQEHLNKVNTPHRPARLEPGGIVAPFLLVDEFGREMQVAFGHGQPRSFLLFFASGCEACEHVYPIWNELFADTESADWRALPIRVDEAGDTGETGDFQLRIPAYALPDDAPSVLQNVSTVPTTLMLDENGRIQRAWTGPLSPDVVQELRGTMASASGR